MAMTKFQSMLLFRIMNFFNLHLILLLLTTTSAIVPLGSDRVQIKGWEGEIILCRNSLHQRSIHQTCSTSTWPSTDYIDDDRYIVGVVWYEAMIIKSTSFIFPKTSQKRNPFASFHFGLMLFQPKYGSQKRLTQYIASLLSPHRWTESGQSEWLDGSNPSHVATEAKQKPVLQDWRENKPGIQRYACPKVIWSFGSIFLGGGYQW